ncbi:non-hydrolyzing UDP-N-acetylglucosamine 2-epimerase [Thiothrix lacustris]|uniref:non-hydrolyzing UDP-N-acetylglucosamine 2-epimerase n=1 Tax=Thiothrix lacustris TaxID=525917 RepID=UPI0004921B64|nr:UDP-N-acetylglucosamine 2-epimerase (non-hydrolyzing) [Thiothrix lacustris]
MKITTIIGARPQFVKAAVVSRAFREHRPDVQETIIHTGQHYDANMSDVFFDELDIPRPDHHLGIGGGTHGQNTGRMLEAIETVLLGDKPDWVLVYGDTDSTLAGALAAAKLHIPVAHVEAGLRSFNRTMPEELNRILTDHVSSLLFTPTDTATRNLANEGITGEKVQQVGDVMYDAALYYRNKAQRPAGIQHDSGFILSTIHRAENTDNPERLSNIIGALNEVAAETPVILPLHPRTRKLLAQGNYDTRNIALLEPISYLQMVWLLEHCKLVVTDSGGLQKEAYFFGKPCVTTRDETEWVELVDSGWNTLVGANIKRISQAFAVKAQSERTELYGSGNTGKLIIGFLQ